MANPETIGRLETLGPILSQNSETSAQQKRDLETLRSQIEGLDADDGQKKPILEQINSLIAGADTASRNLANAAEVSGYATGRKSSLSDGGVTIPGADGGRDTLVQGVH